MFYSVVVGGTLRAKISSR